MLIVFADQLKPPLDAVPAGAAQTYFSAGLHPFLGCAHTPLDRSIEHRLAFACMLILTVSTRESGRDEARGSNPRHT